MEFQIKSGNPEKQRTACVVVGVFEPRRLTGPAELLDKATNGYLSTLIRRGDLEGKLGQVLLLHNVPNTLADRVLMVGCGREREFGDNQYRKAIASAIRTLNETGSMEAVCYLSELSVKGRDVHWKVKQAVESTEETLYRFDQLKSKKDNTRRPLRKVVWSVPSRRELVRGEQAITSGQAIAHGVSLARNLANLPGNICTPSYLAEQALELQKQFPAIKTTILEEKDMKELGMGALLSVSRGSRQPARLVVMNYQGGSKKARPIVLVGKGLTFDAGGISLKPAPEMDEMKYDMCGAASVFGTMSAVAEMGLEVNIIGVTPCSENLPDGDANKPGDVVTSMSGQTIEILNTDAEGRLILCDALTYVERFDPEVVIDIATLTGACVIALGSQCAGLLGNHSPLVHELLNAGKHSGDRAWELPLWEEYQEQLDSNFADMANVGGREAGTITAACFLARYTKKYHWAHLDIAGVSWRKGKDKGATGRPVPLLTQYILDRLEHR